MQARTLRSTSRWLSLGALVALLSGHSPLNGTGAWAAEPAKASGAKAGKPEQRPDKWTGYQEEFETDELAIVIEADPVAGDAPLTVRFSADTLVEKRIEDIKPEYRWDFGDGSPISHEPTPTHVYTKPGDYVVEVKVIDALERRGMCEQDIAVREPVPDEPPAAGDARKPGGSAPAGKRP